LAIHLFFISERFRLPSKYNESGHKGVIVVIEWANIGIIAESSKGSPHITISLLETTSRCIRVEPERHPAEKIKTGDIFLES